MKEARIPTKQLILLVVSFISITIGVSSIFAQPIEPIDMKNPYEPVDVQSMYNELTKTAKETEPSDPLKLTYEDVIFTIVQEDGESYIDLFVRKKPYINSVLLINPQNVIWDEAKKVYAKTPTQEQVDYGLRALKYNPINGDEKRYYADRFFTREDKMWFLIDSTPSAHPIFGEGFQIRIPNYVQYGYDSKNFGLLRITPDRQDIIVNIRTYFRQYADYRGRSMDNYFHIRPGDYNTGDALRFQLWEKSLNQVMLGKDEYFVVRAIFTGHTKFFNFYTLREIVKSPRRLPDSENFTDIGYVTDRSQIRSDACILLESIFKDGKKFVMADIYFKKVNTEREVEINMRDQNNVSAIRSLHYIIPPIGQSVPPIEPNNPRWGDDPKTIGNATGYPTTSKPNPTPYYPERYGRDYIEEGEDPREDPPIY